MVCNAPILAGNSSARVGENAHARALTLELFSGIRASGSDDGRQLNEFLKGKKSNDGQQGEITENI